MSSATSPFGSDVGREGAVCLMLLQRHSIRWCIAVIFNYAPAMATMYLQDTHSHTHRAICIWRHCQGIVGAADI